MKRNYKTFEEVQAQLMKNPKFKKEYEKFDLAWELEKLWVNFRIWFYSLTKEGKEK